MNKHLETILNFIQQAKELSDEAKSNLLKDVQKADGEMEDKNHELEIEAALGSVRSIAMSMNTPDDLLNICKALFEELQHLQFGEVRNAIIHTYPEGNNYFIDYDFSDFNKGQISRIPYSGNPIIEKFVQDIRISKDAFTEIIITGNDLKQWQSFRDANNEVADDRLSKISALYYYMYSIGDASIGISTFNPVPANKQVVLKRFRNVFDLAYKRYVDITNAEARAREAKVEASLERMRAVAMSMNKPGDLLDICETMYREFNSFGFTEMRNAMINIHNDENKTFVNYDYSDTIGRSINHLQYNIHPVIEKQIMQMRSATDAFSETVFEGEDLANWKKFRKDVGEKDDPRINKATALYYYFYSIGTGSIGISSFTPVKEKKLEVLKRFRNVFDLAYKRYTDITLAETQAREAKIEAALERVRSRTMAMQKSEELKEVIQVVYEQFVKLNVPVEHTGFIIDYKEREDMHIWLADRHEVPFQVTIPYFDCAHWNSFNEAKEKEKNFFANILSFEEKNRFYQDLFKLFPVPDKTKEYYLNCPGLAISTVLLDNVGLYIENFSGTPYSNEDNNTLMRFGKVFQQTYTRFLDLQKAEAQAKEAKIEAALERVRSRTMAMQHSRELAELVTVVFRELTQLDFIITSCIIWINKPELSTNELWVTSAEMDKPARPIFFTPFQHSYFNSIIHAWKQKDPKWIYLLSGEEKKSFEKGFFDAAPDLPGALRSALTVPGEVVFSASFNNFGALEILGIQSLTEEKFDILHRFGRVFDLGYTRFNDLVKAEAQAREAQVELALERVRARTMSMQHSDELADAATLVFQQFSSLGLLPEGSRVFFSLIDEDTVTSEIWTTKEGGILRPRSHRISLTASNHLIDVYESWKGKKLIYNKELTGSELTNYLKYIASIPYLKEDKTLQQLVIAPPDRLVFTEAFFAQGTIGVIGVIPLTQESQNTLMRFSKVFEQTYTRFLDLQKAEAYAKKAQVEEQKLRDEKKRSDALLLNILPEEIANELKLFGKSYARKHEEVTILFSDIKGFSSISEDLSADDLVMQLDECFRAFDKIIEKHGLEKIKTVGDAYICACGLPAPVIDNAAKTVRAAIDMLDFLKGFNSSKKVQDLPAFEFRIGIHTGPVVTGVVGLKKFTYDIWGDAVNMAARMEQHGEAGKINVSGNTYLLIKDKFTCTHRGKIHAKNKGEVDMYFVDIVS